MIETTTNLQDRLDNVYSKAENARCCDCFDKKPTFATIFNCPTSRSVAGGNNNGDDDLNVLIGAFYCYGCSCAHQSFGIDHCRVLNVGRYQECKFTLLSFVSFS